MPRQAHKRTRSATGDGDEEQLYTRADASLWDDSELLKIWNDQLGQASSTQESHATDADEAASASSSNGDNSTSNSTGSTRAEQSPRASAALSLAHLPKDVQKLAQSFFDAGYAAGVYAASSRVKK